MVAARLWRSPAEEHCGIVAMINAGAGIAQRFYGRFAQYLAVSGITTLTYDYRGIGGSRPKSLVDFAASVEDWGALDCSAVLEFLARRYPDRRRLVIGHSVGGFLTGFAMNGELVDRMLLVGGHSGYWGDYARWARPWMYALWHVFMPAVTSVVGYFPGRALHLGDDLPAGVARQWAERRRGDFWWNLRTPSGEADTARRDKLLARFSAIRAPTVALRFTDDAFATEAATNRLVSFYPCAQCKTIALHPSDAGCDRIGHFGFFRERMQSFWPRVLDLLNATTAPTASSVDAHAAD